MNTPSKSKPSQSAQSSKASPMNKKGLIASIAEISGLSKSDSAKALEAFILSIQKSLKETNEVRIMGLGTFGITSMPDRDRRNPRTGKPIKVAASKFPKFKASPLLKKALA